MDAQLTGLLQAADHIVKLPSPVPDAEASQFLEAQPLAAVFGVLSSHECDSPQLDTICSALSKVLATPLGTSLLPSATGYAVAALTSPEHRLRRLGCEQLGRLLLLQPGNQQQQQQQLEEGLLSALQDADTGVAGEAEKALAAHAAADASALRRLLSDSSPAGQQLAQLADSRDATMRMRVFALLTAAAAGSSGGLEQLKQSGLMTQLLGQLDGRDPLSCLVALQLLQQLVQHSGPAAAALLEQLLLPSLLRLLDDPSTAAGALPIAARLVAAAAAHGGGSSTASANGGACCANGNGVAAAGAGGAAQALLMRMAEALDDRGSGSSEMEVVVLDAAGQMAAPAAASAALLASQPALMAAICQRALGRTSNPDVRLAALHALASVAGVERAGEARDRSAALLPAVAEDELRRGVFGAVSGAAGGAGGTRTPAEAVLHLLQQPFDETRAGVYRCCSALALRPWFAAEVANNATLLARLCSSDSESGQAACEWRHSAVMALWATVGYLAGLPAGAAEAQQLPAGLQQQLQLEVRGGPYGAAGGAAGARGSQQSHFVVTAPR